MTPTVYIVDDLDENRELLVSLMDSVGVASRAFPGGRAFLDDVPATAHGCLLLDIRMDGMSGIEVLKEMAERGYTLPVVMVTAHADVPVAIESMKLGAFDFVEKPVDLVHVRDVVERAFAVSAARLTETGAIADIRARYGALSRREREVIDLVAAGRLNKQIAFDLGISQRTAEIHRANAMSKMGAASLAELMRMLGEGRLLGSGGD